MKSKKGALGIDTVKAVLIALFIIVIFFIASLITLAALRTAVYQTETQTTEAVANENSTIAVTETFYLVEGFGRSNSACSDFLITNSTSHLLTVAANYTIEGCKVRFSHATEDAGGYVNNTIWNFNYTVVYNQNNYTDTILIKMGEGGQTFFGQVPTFLVLLAVVVLIIIIAIVIVAISRFSGEASLISS